MSNLFQSFVFSLALNGVRKRSSLPVRILERMMKVDKTRYSRSILSFVRNANSGEMVRGVVDALRFADIDIDDEWKAKVVEYAYGHDMLTTVHALELAKVWKCPRVIETVKSFKPYPSPMDLHLKDALLDLENEEKHDESEPQITV